MLKRTPLYPLYAEHGAKVIDFGGWDLPVQFASGIQKEHEAVRQRAGLFDVSHMGEVKVDGSDALAFLQRLTTNDVAKLLPGQAQYSLMCYPDGGVVDDLLVYMLGEERYMLVINASNIDKDLAWMQKQSENFTKLTITNISDETVLLALQGPLAERILQKLTSAPIQDLKAFHFIEEARVGGVRMSDKGSLSGETGEVSLTDKVNLGVTALISRTGYTGEDGFELYAHYDAAPYLWNELLAAGEAEGLMPVGLGARDTLRFEARLPLYGQELSASITPIEAGVGFFVKLDKGDFIGRDVLAEQKANGAPRKLVGIEMMERGIPRCHYPVFSEDGSRIGEVTTGTQSPTLKTNVGLALLNKAYTALGCEVLVEIRGSQVRAKVVSTPFYMRSK